MSCGRPLRALVHFGAEMTTKGHSVREVIRRFRPGVLVLAVVLILVAAAGVIVLVARHNLRTLRVASGAMEPSIAIGTKIEFEIKRRLQLRIGEVVLFHPPIGAGRKLCGSVPYGTNFTGAPCSVAGTSPAAALYIKRVVAGPGDTVSIVGGKLAVNGRAENEPYVKACEGRGTCSFARAIRVPTGTYYLLGDNRGESNDSRFWGPVPRAWIIGHAVRCSFFAVLCDNAY